jgi:hypothetical protein
MYAAISLDYESIVGEVSEDAGTVEVFRVIKRGLTEQPVQVFFSGGVCLHADRNNIDLDIHMVVCVV